ncbi:MAG: glyoxalase [Ilumatobacter sp.]|jgi:catechol 2,3-dioxygenase-like lactoylglutathione lyase family enzyme|nr:glyoxalase [Ilumatobacter sp.]MDG1696104.1 glyoxalase [Ilumatobacter sp.]
MNSAKHSTSASEAPQGPIAPEWVGIDHVQLAIPNGAEDDARDFYIGVLGLSEVPKPPLLAKRGGAWFEAGDVRLHVGVEESFVAASKAHPALTIENLASFIESSELDATWNNEIAGLTRCHIFDPFGNRIELVQT